MRLFPRNRFFVLSIGLASLIEPYASLAQANTITQSAASTRFSYADLQRLRRVDDVELSADGKNIAYTVSGIDPLKDSLTESLWVLHVSHSQAAPVIVPGADAPAWSPDSKELAVVNHGPDGKSTVQLLRSDDLQLVRSFVVTSSPGNLVWAPDGKALAFTLFIPDEVEPSFIQKAVDAAEGELGKPAGAQWAPSVRVTQAAHYRQDGGSWPKPGHTHLFVLSVIDGQIRQIGSEPYDDSDPAWMPDSRTLLFTSDRRPEVEHTSRMPSIFKTDLAGHTVQVGNIQGSCYTPTASPDGKWIAYTEMPFRHVNYTNSDLYIMRADGSERQNIATGMDRSLMGPQWTADGQGVYAEYADHGIFRLGLFGVDGRRKELVAGIAGAFSISRNGDIAYTEQSSTRPDELMIRRAGLTSHRLTSVNDFLNQRELGKLVHVQTRSSADGVTVEGWALLPPNYSEQTRLPTIISMHGGPFGSDGPDWSSRFQLYAAAGYAVVYANYRGSTSYGTSFSEPANHDFPGAAYDDMMSITDEAIRHGFADPDRLFVIGGSAGGQLTAWITGKTNRFRAAVAEKPVINLLSNALTSDQYLASPLFVEGDPWTREKELWAHSPLSLAGTIKTPMLFIVGEEDFRTPLDQALQLYDALQLQTVPTALMHVPGAGHGNLGSRPSQLAAEIAATLAWFHRYDLSPAH